MLVNFTDIKFQKIFYWKVVPIVFRHRVVAGKSTKRNTTKTSRSIDHSYWSCDTNDENYASQEEVHIFFLLFQLPSIFMIHHLTIHLRDFKNVVPFELIRE